MKKYVTYSLWAVLYIICACLGLSAAPEGLGLALCVFLSVLFFVPGALLLYWARREKDQKTVKIIRLIAICVLGLTLILLVANFLSVLLSEAAGNVLYVILVLVSTPMVCSRSWGLILFFWACLLMATFLKKKK